MTVIAQPLIIVGAGYPLAQARFYLTGTTTPATVYSDAAMSLVMSQPVTADAFGIFPQVFAPGTPLLRMKIIVSGGSFTAPFVDIDPVQSNDSGAITFTASDTGAVARTGYAIFNDLVNVKNFGAVGDGVTDDAAAVQKACDAIVARGGGVLYWPGAPYMLKSQVTLAPTGLTRSLLVWAYGVKILTTNAIFGFKIAGNSNPHNCIIEGLSVHHEGNASARGGFWQVNTANLSYPNCTVVADGTVPATYAAFKLTQSDPDDGNTACFWTSFRGTTIRSITGITVPIGIWLDGSHNATDLSGCSIQGVVKGLRMTVPTGTTIPAGSGRAAGGNAIIVDGWFEGLTTLVSFEASAGDYGPYGLHIRGRCESITTLLSITGATIDHYNLPIVEPDSIITVTNIASVPANINYNYIGPGSIGQADFKYNERGYRLRNFDVAYDILTLEPVNNGSGFSITYPGAFTSWGFRLRPSPGFFNMSTNTTSGLFLNIQAIGGLSATENKAVNFVGTKTLAAGTGVVTFGANEIDGNYLVFIDSAVNETFRVTGKGVTGFTITSSNGASTATVGWMIVRRV